ncbi:MAG: glycosyltransferase family 10 [Xanthomonadales bacterium]|nr:glycosyltransferase family 10 [Xanthomonadales bacterium]
MNSPLIRLQFITRKSNAKNSRPFIEQAENPNDYIAERFLISQRNILLTDKNPDYLIILNNPNYEISHPRERTIGIVTEPSWSSNFVPDYLYKKCVYVISHFAAPANNAIFCHSLCLPWVTKKEVSKIPEKSKKLSIIVSPLNPNKEIPKSNYLFRHSLIKSILDSDLDCDIYGDWSGADTDTRIKGYIEHKIDALLPYEFSIAIENTCELGYSTEKLIDCFLAETQPVYLGDPVAQLHYGDHSLIPLDTKNPMKVLQDIINNKIKYNHTAVVAAKNKYLDSFNLLDKILTTINYLEQTSHRLSVNLKPSCED